MDGDSTFLVLDLPWDDIVFSKILPRLEFRDCFNLMNSSEKFHKLVIAYFNQLKKLKTADFINLKDEESEVNLNSQFRVANSSLFFQFLGNNTGALKVLDFTDLPIHVEILKLFLANNRQLMHVALPSTKITDTDLYNLIHCQASIFI